MGKKLAIEWQETASILKQLYRQEQNIERKIRLQVLWQLQIGKNLQEVTQQVGMAYRTLQRPFEK